SVRDGAPLVSAILTALLNIFLDCLGPESATDLIAVSIDPPDWRTDVIIPITAGYSFRSLL
ncbi:MAG: hypothetical protein IJ592_04950, partial [Candidatus Methanomethylophilaceae archaeon]|nr:hypothetical protein [Candidatus Methanomethylophilaceae archaeon]